MIHGLILGLFLLYCLFLAGPVTDILESQPAEAKLENIALPAVNGDIEGSIDHIVFTGGSAEISGMAFIRRTDCKDNRTFIVLKSSANTYVFSTMPVTAYAIAENLPGMASNLDVSAFWTKVPLRKLEKGEYSIGIFIINGNARAMKLIDKKLVNYGKNAEVILVTSNPVTLPLPAKSDNITCFIDYQKEIDNGGDPLTEIKGWAFINSKSTDNNTIYLVLKSDNDCYIFDTLKQKRPEITANIAQPDLDLDNSGFIARITEDYVKKGVYILGLYIVSGDTGTLKYTDTVITSLFRSMPVSLSLPEQSDNITYCMDSQKRSDFKRNSVTEIKGWAYINNISTENNTIYLVLKSNSGCYLYDTLQQKRTDVTAAFTESGLDLDNSGFIARIYDDSIRPGKYKLGLFIRSSNVHVVQYTDTEINAVTAQ